VITLRRHQIDDAGAFYEAARASVDEVFPWLSWCHPEYTRKEAEQWTGSRGSLLDQGIEYEFAIVGDDGGFLGGCGLNQINTQHLMANLGYWVRTSAAGTGVATAAVKLITEFAFQRTDLVRLEILCATGNKASQRVAEKAGAGREGVLRDRLFVHDRPYDAVVFAMLRSTWRATSPMVEDGNADRP
jgi:RimJ/RimL family protein N-acetyltransferase